MANLLEIRNITPGKEARKRDGMRNIAAEYT